MNVEILAPVGNDEMLDAAIAARADAVYLAAKSFGARAFAANFDDAALRNAVARAHRAGMRVYVTVNTLIKNAELEEAIGQIDRLYESGADAVILQDIGLIRAIKDRYPGLALHGSTQMSVTTERGAREAARLGLERIVLGREVPAELAGHIAGLGIIEVEVFVHGSLCVSVSGQCTMSSFAGGRSGNRGRCAQPCRKSYRLERADGSLVADRDFYISPRDLSTADKARDLAEKGVCSLKIEGRMKKPEYVFETVRTYRRALKKGKANLEAMHLMTNRPFTHGFLYGDFGVDYIFRESDLTGSAVGKVEKDKNGLFFAPEITLSKGDIITVQSPKHRFPLTMTDEVRRGERYDLSKYRDLIPGRPVLRIYTEGPRTALQDALEKQRAYREKIDLFVSIRPGEPVSASAVLGETAASVEGPIAEKADKRPLSAEDVKGAFEKTGNTEYEIGSFTLDYQEDCFLRKSELNAVRRELIERLDKERDARELRKPVGRFERPELGEALKPCVAPRITLETARTPKAFGDAIEAVDIAICEDIDVCLSWKKEGKRAVFAPPRWTEDSTYDALDVRLDGASLDGYLARNLNDMGFFRARREKGDPTPIYADHSLHAANDMTLGLLSEEGYAGVHPSLELTAEELAGLHKTMETEYTVFGRPVVMLLRHCPAAPHKGCHDDSGCKTCPYSAGMYLVDEFGRRPFERKAGFTEIRLPELIDMRLRPDAIRQLGFDRWRVIDDRTPETSRALKEWHAYRENGMTDSSVLKRAKGPVSVGHLEEGIE